MNQPPQPPQGPPPGQPPYPHQGPPSGQPPYSQQGPSSGQPPYSQQGPPSGQPPYSQQGPPPGQPPYPPQGPPPGQPPYGPPPGGYPGQPVPKKSRKGLWIGLGIAIVVLLAIAAAIGIGAVKFSSGEDFAVGDCMYFDKLSDKASDSKHEKRDCSDPAATYEIASTADGKASCGDHDLEYTLVDKDDNSKVTETLCLIPNLTEGKCYQRTEDKRFVVADCSAPDTAKIVKRVDGKADEALCAEFPPDSAIAYQKPPRTYCAVTEN